jgi:AcrR family transcriptional regulator
MEQLIEQPIEVGADHRRRLLDGLAASIREKGLVATQVTDIVRHARASRRTFYNAFPDKDACFLALAEELSAEAFALVAASVDDTLGWEQQVDRTIDTYLAILGSDRAMTITFATELATLGLAGQELRRRGVERYAEFVMALTHSEAMRRAGVRELDRHTAIMLIGGIHELVSLAVANGEPLEQLASSVKSTVRAVLAPVRTAREA